MTRKRFIKILMACGISRNRAVALAANARAQEVSYGDAFLCFIAACADAMREKRGETV